MSLKIPHLKLQLHLSGYNALTHWGTNKIADMLQKLCDFLNENCCILIPLKCVPKGLINKKGSIDSDNGLLSNRQQAITWTNVDEILRHHMASLCHNEIIYPLTLLNRDTASPTQPLYSSGFFFANISIRLTADVTTPWNQQRNFAVKSLI